MNPRYKIVAERARHRCEYCGAPERVFNFPFEIEHIWPRARAGVDEYENLALACRACNLFKGLRTTGFDEMLQLEIELFNPRRDTWDEHFQVDKETGLIIGLTNIGRATVHCLQMNSAQQSAARRQWIRWGICRRADHLGSHLRLV